jgi:phage gpG-like protein
MIVSTKLQGDKKFIGKLKAVDMGLRNRKPMYKSLAIETHKWILENMKTGGRLLSDGKWKRLRPSTIAMRRKKSNVPLLDTGQNIRNRWAYKYSHTRAVIGHPSDIAAYHNEGGKKWYEIKPKKAKTLHFKVPSAYRPGKKRMKKGQDVFVTRVYHPPLPQRRMLPKEREIMPRLRKVVDFWLRKLTE